MTSRTVTWNLRPSKQTPHSYAKAKTMNSVVLPVFLHIAGQWNTSVGQLKIASPLWRPLKWIFIGMVHPQHQNPLRHSLHMKNYGNLSFVVKRQRTLSLSSLRYSWSFGALHSPYMVKKHTFSPQKKCSVPLSQLHFSRQTKWTEVKAFVSTPEAVLESPTGEQKVSLHKFLVCQYLAPFKHAATLRFPEHKAQTKKWTKFKSLKIRRQNASKI